MAIGLADDIIFKGWDEAHTSTDVREWADDDLYHWLDYWGYVFDEDDERWCEQDEVSKTE